MAEITTLGAPIKTAYEGQPNTNAFTDSEKAKLSATPSTFDKNTVGLGNVDNTSDADKPVSIATQTALNLKISSDISPYAGSGKITNEIFCTQAQYDGYALSPPADFNTTIFNITDA